MTWLPAATTLIITRCLLFWCVRLSEEKAAALTHCEETVTAKNLEVENLKLSVERVQQELLFAKDQVRARVLNRGSRPSSRVPTVMKFLEKF